MGTLRDMSKYKATVCDYDKDIEVRSAGDLSSVVTRYIKQKKIWAGISPAFILKIPLEKSLYREHSYNTYTFDMAIWPHLGHTSRGIREMFLPCGQAP